MKPLFVKICGITRAQDAGLASDLGASALGFVLWPGSPRYIRPEAAQAIVRQQPPGVMKVGVFVDEPGQEVARIVSLVGLDAVQLHGHESPEYCRELSRLLRDVAQREKSIIKAVAMHEGMPADVGTFDEEVVILLDAHDPSRHGGTGRTVDWHSASQVAAARRTILAGGLSAGNVGLAVNTVRPYGIDVSSGVESSPGVKDPERLRSFFEALND